MNKKIIAYAVRSSECGGADDYDLITCARSPQEAAEEVVKYWSFPESNRSRTITTYVAPVHVALCRGRVVDHSAAEECQVTIPPDDLDEAAMEWED